jgi:hypothetical protein
MGRARDRRRRPWQRIASVVAVCVFVLLLVASAGPILGASPEPTPAVIDPGDPRSETEGPGGMDTVLAVGAGVILLGVAAAGTTLLFLRLTREDRG